MLKYLHAALLLSVIHNIFNLKSDFGKGKVAPCTPRVSRHGYTWEWK